MLFHGQLPCKRIASIAAALTLLFFLEVNAYSIRLNNPHEVCSNLRVHHGRNQPMLNSNLVSVKLVNAQTNEEEECYKTDTLYDRKFPILYLLHKSYLNFQLNYCSFNRSGWRKWQNNLWSTSYTWRPKPILWRLPSSNGNSRRAENQSVPLAVFFTQVCYILQLLWSTILLLLYSLALKVHSSFIKLVQLWRTKRCNRQRVFGEM